MTQAQKEIPILTKGKAQSKERQRQRPEEMLGALFCPVLWSSGHQKQSRPPLPPAKSDVRLYRARHPGTINLPGGLADLVSRVFHPCLGLRSPQGAPGGQDHPAPPAPLILN